MMKLSHQALTAGAALALATSAGYGLRVLAEGAPSMKPVFYSGTLEAEGKLASGTYAIVLALYEAEMGGTAVCNSETTKAPVVSGRFRVEVSADCVAAMRAKPDLWAGLKFTGPDGVPHELPDRTKVGAVPYAMEAQHAVSASVATDTLAGQIVPSGMIAMFATACPAGWSEYGPMAGKFPRGEKAGQPLDMGGSDDAVVVAHTHPLQVTTTAAGDHQHGCSASTSAAGSHSHLQYVVAPKEAAGCNAGTFRQDWVQDHEGCPLPQNGVNTAESGSHAHAASCSTTTSGSHSHGASGTATSTGVSGANANLPKFQEVVFCIKQ